MDLELLGKRAVITGGSRGIGYAVANALASEGVNRLEHLRGSALGFRNLTNYIARSLLEAGGFRPHLHPDAKIRVGEAGRRAGLGRLVESDPVSHALELVNSPAFGGFWP